MDVMIVIFLIILFSFILSEILRYFKITKTIAPIIVGICFGFFRSYFEEHIIVLEILSELGIIMLLFYTGLEIDLKNFKKSETETIIDSILGIVLSFSLGFIFTYFFLDLSLIASFVTSSALSVTAPGVMTIILEENRLIKSKIGTIILGAGILDDIFGMTMLLILSFIVSSQEFTIKALQPFFIGFICIFLFFKFFKIIKAVLTEIFKLEDENDYTGVFTLAIIFVFFLAGFSNYLGFDFSIGAILAGVILNVSLRKKDFKPNKEEHIIDKFIKAISFGFLNYFFFFWIGFNMDIFIIYGNLFLGLVLCLIGFSGKVFAGLLSSYLYKGSFKEGFLVGLGMSVKGVVALVIAEVANKNGLLTPEIFSSIVFMGIVLTIFPPILFNYITKTSPQKIF